MEKQYLITTPRLGFRLWQATDLEPFAAMNANPEVMRYFPSLLSEKQSQSLIEKVMQHQEKYGYCAYAVDLLKNKQFIGYIGFMKPSFEEFFTPCVEIAWRLDNRFWNQGLATEGALACLEYGFEALDFNEIYSFTTVLNIPSERIMQKIGMTKIGTFEHPLLDKKDKLRTHLLYKILKNS